MDERNRRQTVRPRRRVEADDVTDEDRRAGRDAIASVTPMRRQAGPGRARRATSPNGVRLAERRHMALNMRKLGFRWSQIAAEIKKPENFDQPGYTAASAYRDVRTVLDRVMIEAARSIRGEDLAVLAAMQRRTFPLALSGDLDAVQAMLGILDLRARYLGLYASRRQPLPGRQPTSAEFEAADPAATYAAALAVVDALLPIP